MTVPTDDATLRSMVGEAVTEALSVALPIAVKLIGAQVEARLAAQHQQRALFHDWRDRG